MNKANNQTTNTEYLATESELKTDARTWNKQSTFLALLSLFLLVTITGYVNHKTTDSFTKAMEKHYNITFPEKLYTKSQKLKWFCSNYKLNPAGCRAVSSIESKIQKGNLAYPYGFDIQAYEKDIEETLASLTSSFYNPEKIKKGLEERKILKIEAVSMNEEEMMRSGKYGAYITFFMHEPLLLERLNN